MHSRRFWTWFFLISDSPLPDKGAYWLRTPYFERFGAVLGGAFAEQMTTEPGSLLDSSPLEGPKLELYLDSNVSSGGQSRPLCPPGPRWAEPASAHAGG